MARKSTNVVAVGHQVTDQQRWAANRHLGGVVWLTGLPGSGKSTLAIELEGALFDKAYQVYVLDGDNLRHGF